MPPSLGNSKIQSEVEKSVYTTAKNPTINLPPLKETRNRSFYSYRSETTDSLTSSLKSPDGHKSVAKSSTSPERYSS